MVGFVIFVHVVVCIFLTIVVLMQSGRGGGLAESFSAAESMFGTKTSGVLVKTTTIFAFIFLVTCLSLAFFSATRHKSLMSDEPIGQPDVVHVQNNVIAVKGATMNAVVDTKKTEENAGKKEPATQQLPEPVNPQKSQ